MQYRLFQVLLFYIVFSSFIYVHPANSTSLREEEFQAYTKLFHHYLEQLKQDLEKHNFTPTIFICYAPPNETEDTPQLNTLTYDLIRSGIKESNLYYKLRPGEGITKHQYANRIFEVCPAPYNTSRFRLVFSSLL